MKLKKLLIILSVIALIVLARYYGLQEYLSFESLKNNKELLNSYYAQNEILFISAYILLYIISVAVALPGATILTIGSGALFGLLKGVSFKLLFC